MAGATYELTRTPDGRVYLRYLTGGAKVGCIALPYFLPSAPTWCRTPKRRFLPPPPSPARRVPLPGSVAFYNKARPTSVYFAYSGSNVQVETYDPSASVARQLVESGAIKPIG